MINNHRKCGLPLGYWIFLVGYWLFKTFNAERPTLNAQLNPEPCLSAVALAKAETLNPEFSADANVGGYVDALNRGPA